MFIVVRSQVSTLTFYCSDSFSLHHEYREEASLRCTAPIRFVRQGDTVSLQHMKDSVPLNYTKEVITQEIKPGVHPDLVRGYSIEVYPEEEADAAEVRGLAANEATPSGVLSGLLSRFDLPTHEALAQNPNLVPALLDVLCFTCPAALAKNPSWGLWLMEDGLIKEIPADALLNFLVYGELGEELLFALLARCQPGFRRDFAASEAPPGYIKRLCQTEEEVYLRPLLQRLAKTPEAREEYLFAILQRLTKSERMELARGSETEGKLKIALAYDLEEDVRISLMKELLYLPEEGLQAVLGRDSQRVQEAFREALTEQYFVISIVQVAYWSQFSSETKERSRWLLSLWEASWGEAPVKAGATSSERTICVVMKGDGETRRLDFQKTMIVFGRVMGNDIVIPSGNVSKRHCVLFHDGRRCYILDAKSTGGTYVNRSQIRRLTAFGSQDRLRLGGYDISVEFEDW